jgi:hypothetical protein
MKHNYHQQHDCDHEIKLCKQCDTVYCTKCGKEWMKNWYATNTYIPTSPNYFVDSGTATGGTAESSHKHD